MSIYNLINKKKKAQKVKTAKTAALTAAIGITAGAAAGVLLAPKSGKETREDIAKKSVDAKDALIEKSNKAKVVITEKVAETKNDVSEAKGKISAYLASKRKASEEVCDLELTNETEEVLTEEIEGIEETIEETVEA